MHFCIGVKLCERPLHMGVGIIKDTGLDRYSRQVAVDDAIDEVTLEKHSKSSPSTSRSFHACKVNTKLQDGHMRL